MPWQQIKARGAGFAAKVDDKPLMDGLRDAYCSTGVSDASKEWNELRNTILQELYQVCWHVYVDACTHASL